MIVAVRTLVLASPGKPDEESLRRQIAADAIPDVVSPDDAIGATILDDRYIAAVPGARGWILRRLPLLAAQAIEVRLEGKRYDAVLSWSDHRAVCIGAVMRLWRRRPAHVAVLLWPSVPKKARLLRLTQRGVDRFIVRAPLQRRFAEEKLGIEPERFVEGKKYIDTKFWRPMPGPGELICSVGQEMRDFDTLIEALEPLGIRCHIAVGTGICNNPRDKWWRPRRARDVGPHITIGHLSFAELRDLYARARFVVVPLLPSDQDNGINTIVEAFAMGKAVICTETAGQVGILEPGVNCLRVPPRDVAALREAICELWNDPQRCDEFGAAGRALVIRERGVEQWRDSLVQAVSEATAARAAAGRARDAEAEPLRRSASAPRRATPRRHRLPAVAHPVVVLLSALLLAAILFASSAAIT